MYGSNTTASAVQGITCHTVHSRHIAAISHKNPKDMLKKRRVSQSQPDRDPFAFFSGVYASPPSTLQELRNRISDTCASVSRGMLRKVQR
ncbi:hypothetical protein TNCV_1115101 [Trichonephila clavipes]|nr:hypothetical protein TNCV_1115101 [Trichonephila clavipes]